MNYLGDQTIEEPDRKQRFRIVPTYSSDPNADVLLRFKSDGTKMCFAGLMPTEDAMDTVQKLHKEKEILVGTIVSCGRYMSYSALHTSYLMGHVTEEAFHKAAREFCVESGMPIKGLAERIEVIIRETGQWFPPEQLEEFCSATGEDVEAALGILQEKGVVAIRD